MKLINPSITATGYKIGNRGFTKYVLHADDMVKAWEENIPSPLLHHIDFHSYAKDL